MRPAALGVAPTACAACMMSRMVEAKPTTTAVAAEEMMLNQPLRETATSLISAELPAHISKPA